MIRREYEVRHLDRMFILICVTALLDILRCRLTVELFNNSGECSSSIRPVIRPVSASRDTVTSVRPPEMLQHDVRMQVSNERQLSLSVSNTIVRLTLRVDGDCSSVRCTYASLSYVRTCSTSIAFQCFR